MSTIFKEGDRVRIVQLPQNYGGTLNEIMSLVGLELVVETVYHNGLKYDLALPEPIIISANKIYKLPVEHNWVEAILTVEATNDSRTE